MVTRSEARAQSPSTVGPTHLPRSCPPLVLPPASRSLARRRRPLPFRVEAVERKRPATGATAAAASPAELELRWVCPVAVDRHWYTDETPVRFAVVLGGCNGHVAEVSLAVKDADSVAVSGEGTLCLLAAAMEGAGGGQEAVWRNRQAQEGEQGAPRRRVVLVAVASAVVVLTCLAAVALRLMETDKCKPALEEVVGMVWRMWSDAMEAWPRVDLEERAPWLYIGERESSMGR
ncbi:hypothetical protein HU200_029379 [Digitaria exilis]|uniref:Uncharacterized protein n=1 Tax=Digitaria exilis TaxID=1010633 RepID=A0A835BUL2_9POAL|nr:hypothetical protein HU200_029379 [Digitaria exilis]